MRDAILPFLRSVGEAWAEGEVTPGQEHFASTTIEDLAPKKKRPA